MNDEATAAGATDTLAELQQLITQLEDQVQELRDADLDSEALEQRLRSLAELAAQASSVIESAAR
ncbi:MAG TPA: hypothetical protein VGO97_01610 [Solirubrobacterales bacterium]|jgi:hypothetical protein|nr:hypothetical protein [Solirubrobacterales bacterium]